MLPSTVVPRSPALSDPRRSPRTDARRRLAQEGEARAAAWLRAAGYRIAARNVRAGGVELDVVATRGRLVVFVEVKTRSGRRHGAPEEAVDGRKRARIVRGAAAWLREHGARGARARFDVITCEPGPDGELAVRHWPGAFDADDARG